LFLRSLANFPQRFSAQQRAKVSSEKPGPYAIHINYFKKDERHVRCDQQALNKGKEVCSAVEL